MKQEIRPIKYGSPIWNAKMEGCSNCGYDSVANRCLCGMNKTCTKCGYGFAAYPCKCQEKKK